VGLGISKEHSAFIFRVNQIILDCLRLLDLKLLDPEVAGIVFL
jgi:hypothetical protein